MNLKKELGLLDVFCVASGAMISSGLFILPGLVYLKSGPAVFIAYLLAGLLVLPAMLSKAELATAMPKAGGDYFYIDRSMGAGMGTLAGLSAWFSLSFKSAFALLGIGAFASLIAPDISMVYIKVIAVSFCVLFIILNIVSTKHAGRFQIFLVLSLIVILIFYIFRGFSSIKLENFQPFMKGSFKTLFSSAGLIFISYGGLTKISSIAEEVKNPTRNLPLGMILAFVIVTILYALTVFVTVGVAGDSLILANGKATLTPISDAASGFMGRIGSIVLALAALMAFISTGNAGILAASRSPLAMSRDGLLPSVFSKLTKKSRTPITGILFTGIFMIIVILFLDLEMLVKTASTIKILLFGTVNLAVIIMRESRIQNYRPKFKSPFYPWIQILGTVVYGFLIFEMGKVPLFIATTFFISGLLWYWLYGRIRSNRESALVRLIQRISAKDFTSTELETELKHIILERDEIVKDRFDTIIEKCKILDFDNSMTKEQLFDEISSIIAEDIKIKPDEIHEQLLDREKESSTAFTPFLAVPHIIVPGTEKFTIIVARNKEGFYFSEESKSIKMVFFIIGSRDERTFHLKALAAVAQLIQNPNFEERWLKATDSHALRDVILLGKRKR